MYTIGDNAYSSSQLPWKKTRVEEMRNSQVTVSKMEPLRTLSLTNFGPLLDGAEDSACIAFRCAAGSLKLDKAKLSGDKHATGSRHRTLTRPCRDHAFCNR